jgi:hypothetical protein
MVAHEKLAEGVYQTTYENGSFALVNYNDFPVQAGGHNVEAKSYVTGGEQL